MRELRRQEADKKGQAREDADDYESSEVAPRDTRGNRPQASGSRLLTTGGWQRAGVVGGSGGHSKGEYRQVQSKSDELLCSRGVVRSKLGERPTTATVEPPRGRRAQPQHLIRDTPEKYADRRKGLRMC